MEYDQEKHNHTLQTNSRHRKGETQNIISHMALKSNFKQPNLSSPSLQN